MMRALNTAGAGMLAQQTNLDVLSNNLANSTTNAYKGQRAQFADMMYQTVAASSAEQYGRPSAVQVGLGTQWTGNATDLTPGAPIQTNNPLNVAINGNGYFQVDGPGGVEAYTRDGSFTTDATGQLVTQQGYLLTPNIIIPPRFDGSFYRRGRERYRNPSRRGRTDADRSNPDFDVSKRSGTHSHRRQHVRRWWRKRRRFAGCPGHKRSRNTSIRLCRGL